MGQAACTHMYKKGTSNDEGCLLHPSLLACSPWPLWGRLPVERRRGMAQVSNFNSQHSDCMEAKSKASLLQTFPMAHIPQLHNRGMSQHARCTQHARRWQAWRFRERESATYPHSQHLRE